MAGVTPRSHGQKQPSAHQQPSNESASSGTTPGGAQVQSKKITTEGVDAPKKSSNTSIYGRKDEFEKVDGGTSSSSERQTNLAKTASISNSPQKTNPGDKDLSSSSFSLRGKGSYSKAKRQELTDEERAQKKEEGLQRSARARELKEAIKTPLPEDSALSSAPPFRARPSSALVGSQRMTWQTDPRAPTPGPFRHSTSKEETAATSEVKRRSSFSEDFRERALLRGRMVPESVFKTTGADEYRKATQWTDYNRRRVGQMVYDHGGRDPDGGWKRPPGGTSKQPATEDQKTRAGFQQVGQLLSRDDLQAKLGVDTWKTPVLKVRAPDLDQQGGENRGRGVMFDKLGLRHLMNPFRDEETFARDKARLEEKESKVKKGVQK